MSLAFKSGSGTSSGAGTVVSDDGIVVDKNKSNEQYIKEAEKIFGNSTLSAFSVETETLVLRESLSYLIRLFTLGKLCPSV